MAEVNRPFITTLEHATLQMGNDADAHPKYTISTIGQEIAFGALQVENAQEHVFGFFRAVASPEYVRDPGRSDPAGVTRRGPTGRRGDTGNIPGPDLYSNHERLGRLSVYE